MRHEVRASVQELEEASACGRSGKPYPSFGLPPTGPDFRKSSAKDDRHDDRSSAHGRPQRENRVDKKL